MELEPEFQHVGHAMKHRSPAAPRRLRSNGSGDPTVHLGGDERGVTLIETMIAAAVAVVAVLAISNTIFVATVATKNQGTETTRATICAQDKTEKLLALASVPTTATTAGFSNCTQPTATQQASYPDCDVTGITAAGWATGLLAGGSTSPLQMSCPASGSNIGYTDFLDQNGNQLTGAGCSAALSGKWTGYIRQWQITDADTFGATPALKQITVAVYSLQSVNTNNTRPIAMVTTYVSDPD
jgi:Tfp pilus assembly protein PilV